MIKTSRIKQQEEVMNSWSTVIEPGKYSLRQDLKELWQYRELIKMFVQRDLKTMYAQTILGPLWFVITVLLSTTVFQFVFGKIAQISTNGIPQFLFFMSGNILWSNFSGCFSSVSSTFVSNARLMGKVYFPRLCVPIATILSRQVRFVIQFVVFLLIYIWCVYDHASIFVTKWVWLTPVLLMELMVLSLGLGIIIASFTTIYRDLTVLLSFGIQMWMYATPVVYPVSELSEKWMHIAMLNPVAPILECFRYIWFGCGMLPIDYLLISMGETVGILIIGIVLFQKTQRTFLDTI